jgi:hypothetical protein
MNLEHLDCNNNEVIDDTKRCTTTAPVARTSLIVTDSQNDRKSPLYHCFLCNGIVGCFSSSLSLCKHLESIHRMSATIHCPICKTVFSNSKHCNEHIVNFHKIIVGSTFFKCRLCPKEFSNSKVKDSHILNHYYKLFPKARPFLCEICNITTFGLNNFLVHLQTHFIVCSFCNGMFKTSTEFYEHFTKAHSSDIKCGVCQDSIKNCESYLNHLYMHKIDCPVNVPTPSNDINYKMEKHLCFVCDDLFSTKQQFLNHFAQQHGFLATLLL